MATQRPTKRFELVGSSRQGVQQAIENAILQTGQTICDLDWFEVKAIRGNIQHGKVGLFQVKLGMGFRALDPEDIPMD